tara:strand:+ start:3000 stop:3947 length:948 start_codon:yes stop_codon:yes gene_type:complete
MSFNLTVKHIPTNDYQQIFIEDMPTNLFINKEGRIKFRSIDEDVLEDVLTLNPEKLIIKSSDIHLDGDKNLILDDTSSKIIIQDPGASGESLKVYHNADDAIIESTDSTNIVLDAGDGQTLEFWHNGGLRYRMSGLSFKHAFHYTSNDYFEIDVDANGATVMKTVDASTGTEGDLLIDADGELKLDAATDHHIELGKGTGFTQGSASSASDVAVDFRDTQKYLLTMSGNVTNLNMQFPSVSGNFTLLVKQDGSTRTITNYNVLDSGGSAASGSGTVKFSGGSNPDLTDGGNKVDIISMYWDATNEICYGVASLNF